MVLAAREDFGRVALGAPALKEVFIVSVPDCLLVKSWARAGRTNAEETAAQLGGLFRAGIATLKASSGEDVVDGITVESGRALVRIEIITQGMIAAFVFDRSAPLGLVNVQALQLRDHIRSSVEQFQKPGESDSVDQLSVETIDAPASAAGRVSRDPEAPFEADTARFAREGTPTAERAAPPPLAEPSSVESPEDDAEITGRFDATTIDTPEEPLATPEAPARPLARPRATRLLDFFRRYAPDPHAALLRLSLRTGIPVDLLEAPDALEDPQVEALAAAVRDILGQDQVGV